MADSHIKIVSAAEARRELTDGGIRDEVAFQNDINTLLARLEEKVVPLKALTPPIKAATRKPRKKAGRA
jgi:hypothetical protein